MHLLQLSKQKMKKKKDFAAHTNKQINNLQKLIGKLNSNARF